MNIRTLCLRVVLFCFISTPVFAERNIFLVYGDMGTNVGVGDPAYYDGPWHSLEEKGYTTYRIYDIAPETMLRIFADPNTLGVLYVGHGQATQEEYNKGIAYPSVVKGKDEVQLNQNTFKTAKNVLKKEGISFKDSSSVKFVSIGSCYSASCKTLLINEFGLANDAVLWSHPGLIDPRYLVNEHKSGSIGNWMQSLPKIDSVEKSKVDWKTINNHYRLQHLFDKRAENPENPSIDAHISIAHKELSRHNSDIWQPLLDSALDKVTTASHVKELLDSVFLGPIADMTPWLEEIQVAKVNFLKKLYTSGKWPADLTSRGLSEILDAARIDYDLRRSLFDDFIKNAKTADEFISFVEIAFSNSSRNSRDALEELIEKNKPRFMSELHATESQLTTLRAASKCPGFFKRIVNYLN